MDDVLEMAEMLLRTRNTDALALVQTVEALAAEVRELRERDAQRDDAEGELLTRVEELRKDKARLEAGIAAVVNLHGPNHDPDGWAFCNLCRDDFKCPTICALDAAMGGEG